MNTTEILEVSRETIFVLLQIGAPVMVVTLIVGLAVSLIQALTQIQEQTLVFVPKIIVAMLSLILLLPFMVSTLTGFTERLADRIINIG
jgi:flagellar biosynthetic protein FliQ